MLFVIPIEMSAAHHFLQELVVECGGDYLQARATADSILTFVRSHGGRTQRKDLDMTERKNDSLSSAATTWDRASEPLINQFCAEAILFWVAGDQQKGLGGTQEFWYTDTDGAKQYMVDFWNPCINPAQAKEVLAEIGWTIQGDHDCSGAEIHARVGVLGTALSLADHDPKLALVLALGHLLEAKVPTQPQPGAPKEAMHA